MTKELIENFQQEIKERGGNSFKVALTKATYSDDLTEQGFVEAIFPVMDFGLTADDYEEGEMVPDFRLGFLDNNMIDGLIMLLQGLKEEGHLKQEDPHGILLK